MEEETRGKITRPLVLSILLGILLIYAALPIDPCGFGSSGHSAYGDLIRYSRLPGMPPDQAAYLRSYAEPLYCPRCKGTGRTSRLRITLEILSVELFQGGFSIRS